MPFPLIPLLVAGGSSLLGGLLGNRSQKQNSSQNIDNTTSYTLNPQDQQLKDYLMAAYMKQFGDTDLTGYANSGLRNINTAARGSQDLMQRFLASRGLSFSPAAAPMMQSIENNRFAQGIDFMNQIPMLQRQLQTESLGGLSNLFSMSRPTTRTQGTATTEGVQQGNMLGGGFSSLATMLAGLYGMGAFQKTTPSVSGNQTTLKFPWQ